MRLAYSTNGYQRVDLPTAVRQIASHGYEGVELLADRPHWSPEAGAEAVKAVRRALEETGMALSNVNANTAMGVWPEWIPELTFEPSLSNHDPAVRQRRLDYTYAALDFAAEVGSERLSVTSGRTEGEVPPEEGWAFFADSLAKVCERAASMNLKVGIEAEPALLVATTDEVLDILDRVGHPALGANLDLGHAICAGEDPCESIAKLAGRIWNVHVEDLKAAKHYHLVPGEGDVDFGALFAALRAVDYPHFVTVELYTCSAIADEAASRAIAHLRSLEAHR